MKIEMTVDTYSDAKGFKLVGVGMQEVTAKQAQYLLSTLPDWFKPGQSADEIEGVEEITPVDEIAPVQETDSEPEAQPVAEEAEDSQPEEDVATTKPLSKMNKDELLVAAGEVGLAANADMTNKELQDAIKEHQEAA